MNKTLVSIDKIEKEFKKKFEILEYSPKQGGWLGTGTTTANENVMKFYRQQILVLLKELEGEMPKEKRFCVNCGKETPDTPCPYCGRGIFRIINKMITVEEVKAILQNKMKEVKK